MPESDEEKKNIECDPNVGCLRIRDFEWGNEGISCRKCVVLSNKSFGKQWLDSYSALEPRPHLEGP